MFDVKLELNPVNKAIAFPRQLAYLETLLMSNIGIRSFFIRLSAPETLALPDI